MTIVSAAPEPRRPALDALGWEPGSAEWQAAIDALGPPQPGARVTLWRNGECRVMSCTEWMDATATMPAGWQWHVSFSLAPVHRDQAVIRRAPAFWERRVRRDFGMQDAEEDNHVPDGRVRNLWLPCHLDNAPACECADLPETRTPFGEAGGDLGGEYVYRPAPEKP